MENRERGEPGRDGLADGPRVRLQPVIALDRDDLPARRLGRHPEAVALALHDEDRDVDGLELGETTLRRPVPAAGREEGKGEAEYRLGPRPIERPTGDASTQRPSAGDQGQIPEGVGPEVLDDGDPRFVEPLGGSRGAPARDAIGLLDERDGEPRPGRRIPRRDQVRCLDAPARPVAEDNRTLGVSGSGEVRPGGTGGSVDLDGQWS
jgi:hypothetical protein